MPHPVLAIVQACTGSKHVCTGFVTYVTKSQCISIWLDSADQIVSARFILYLQKLSIFFQKSGSYVKLRLSYLRYSYSHSSPFARKSVANSRLQVERSKQFGIRNSWYQSFRCTERAPKSRNPRFSSHPRNKCFLDASNGGCHQFSADSIKKQKTLLQ